MKPIILDCDQRSPEWFRARAGRLTGSVADAITATLKSGGEPAARRDLRLQLAVESITGEPMETEGFVSKEMQRGIDLEAEAIGVYEAVTGNMVRRTGFITHPELSIGCSLDGDVDDFAGIVEIKAPKSATHVGYIRANRLPPEYVAQVTHNLWVSGAQWADFVSYDSRLPESLQFFLIRVPRDEIAIKAYAERAERFLAEVRVEMQDLLALRAAA